MSWNTETLENAVAAAPIDPATKKPTLRGVDSRGQSVTVSTMDYHDGFDMLINGTIYSRTKGETVHYLNALSFVPDGEVAK